MKLSDIISPELLAKFIADNPKLMVLSMTPAQLVFHLTKQGYIRK